MSFKRLSVVTIIFLSVAFLQAQQPVEECPEFSEELEEVDMINEKLIGIWYLHASIARFYEFEMKCTFINVTAGENELHFVKHEFHNVTNDPRETFGFIEFTREGITDIFYTDLLLPLQYHTIALNEDYWILVACHECGFYSEGGAGVYTYVFTRLQYPECEMNAKIMEHLNDYDIGKRYVVSHDQNNCPFC